MRRCFILFVLACLCGTAWYIYPVEAQPDKERKANGVPPPQACVHEPHDKLCPDIPHDILEQFGAGYSQLAPAQQRPFDNFSWQSFVALN